MMIKKVWKNKLSLLSFFVSATVISEAKTIQEVPGTDFSQTIWNNSSGVIMKYGDGVTITTSGSGNGAGIGANAGVYSNFGGDMIVGNELTIKTTGTAADAIRTNPSGVSDYNNSIGVVTIGDKLVVRVSGVSADGINANGQSKVTVGDYSDFVVGGIAGYAVRANHGSEVIVGNNMKIEVNAGSSYAVYTDRGSASLTGYTGGSSIDIGDFADIKTTGSSAHAVYLNNINSSIKFKDNGRILTDGNNADGLVISANGSNGIITVGNDFSIETLKEKSDGIVTAKDGIVNTGDNFSIKTNANESTGITAKESSRVATGSNAKIETLGDKAHGIFLNSPSAAVNSGSLSIVTTGELSDGILASSGGNVTAGILNIETNNAASYGIHLAGDSSNVNSISGGRIHSEGTAVKFQTNAAGTDGQHVTLTGVTLTNNGTAASVITGSSTDVDNAGNLIQAGGLTAINGNSDQVIDSVLSLYNSTATAGGNKDLLNVSNGSTFTFNNDNTLLTGNIETDSTSYATVNLANNSMLEGAVNKVNNINNLDMNITASTWQITEDSWVRNLNNSGKVSFSTTGTTLTVNGDYIGNNGILNIKTVLEDDNSVTDKLHVLGDTSGETQVNVEKAGGNGAATTEGIKIVEIAGNSSGNFTLSAPVQAGIYEYNLYKGGVSTPNDGNWYLRSHYYEEPKIPDIPVEEELKEPEKVVPPPVTSKDPVITYRPGVSNYISGQRANAEQGMLQFSTYHQRMGKQEKDYTEEKHIWARAYGSHQHNEGKERFDYSQTITGIQLGMGLYDKVNNSGTIDQAGIILDYSYANARFFDDLRPDEQGKNTGRMHAQSAALGGYYTKTTSNSAYIDIIGMVSLLDNDFKDSYGEKSSQKGWRTGISAEAGIPFVNNDGWGIEPQVQLAYQYTDYRGFDDSYSHIEGYDTDMLRGRGGFRVFKDLGNSGSQIYGVANIVHDFTGNKELEIDGVSIEETYDKSYGEAGLGFYVKATEKSSIYGDMRYQKSFGGNMENAVFSIGFKTEF
jgi:autotransporter family porin